MICGFPASLEPPSPFWIVQILLITFKRKPNSHGMPSQGKQNKTKWLQYPCCLRKKKKETK